jgi:hypothetical protein
MQKKYNSHALRSTYRRFGILDGDRQNGLVCLICNMEIYSIRHFSMKHVDYYYRAIDVIEGRFTLKSGLTA